MDLNIMEILHQWTGIDSRTNYLLLVISGGSGLMKVGDVTGDGIQRNLGID
jgi:hypothetical protein